MITYRVDIRQVTTDLFRFSERTVEHLKEELGGLAQEKLLPEIRSAWAPHRKDGDLESSLRVTVKARGVAGKGGQGVTASVVAGGARRAAHAHLFERGFSGVEQVDAHQRTYPWSKLGLTFPVQAYARTVNYPPHEYMKKVLDSNEAAVAQAVERALSKAAAGVGLG